MVKKVHAFITSFLTREGYLDSEHLYIRLILIAATSFAAFIHVALLVVYIVINLPILIALNLVSFLIYTISYILVKNGHYTLCGLSISLEVAWYTVFSAYYLGINSHPFLYIFVVLLMQIIVPYTKHSIRTGMSVVLWCSIMACLILGNFTEPRAVLDTRADMLLGMININVCFFGMIAVVWIGNSVQKIIANSNSLRLDELRKQAYTDPLTGLYNRHYSDKLFTQIRNDMLDEKYCVALVDIDDFKAINDLYGHALGDTVLIFLADLMRKTLRKTDTIIRWGGEEFLLVLHGAEINEAYKTLESLRDSVANMNIEIQKKKVNITITIGIACVDTKDIEASINLADQRLYNGKAGGKNNVTFAE